MVLSARMVGSKLGYVSGDTIRLDLRVFCFEPLYNLPSFDGLTRL